MAMIIARRPLLIGLAATLVGLPPAFAVIPSAGRLAFKVSRKGDPMGTHNLSFSTESRDVVVDVAIDLKVTLLAIPVFRYTHRNRERWRDGRLIAIEAQTDEDGDKLFCRGKATAEGFAVEGSAGNRVFPADVMTTSWWNPEVTKRRELLNTQDGAALPIGVTPRGPERVPTAAGEIPAERFDIAGEVPLELWYDTDKVLARIRFKARRDGSVIDYVRT
jgi:hypothetical protein